VRFAHAKWMHFTALTAPIFECSGFDVLDREIAPPIGRRTTPKSNPSQFSGNFLHFQIKRRCLI